MVDHGHGHTTTRSSHGLPENQTTPIQTPEEVKINPTMMIMVIDGDRSLILKPGTNEFTHRSEIETLRILLDPVEDSNGENPVIRDRDGKNQIDIDSLKRNSDSLASKVEVIFIKATKASLIHVSLSSVQRLHTFLHRTWNPIDFSCGEGRTLESVYSSAFDNKGGQIDLLGLSLVLSFPLVVSKPDYHHQNELKLSSPFSLSFFECMYVRKALTEALDMQHSLSTRTYSLVDVCVCIIVNTEHVSTALGSEERDYCSGSREADIVWEPPKLVVLFVQLATCSLVVSPLIDVCIKDLQLRNQLDFPPKLLSMDERLYS